MRKSNALLCGLLLFIAFSCKKKDFEKFQNNISWNSDSISRIHSSSLILDSATCVDDTDSNMGYDTILKPTILGYRLINHPYSLENMQQAYINLYGNADGVAATHNYIRFKPSNPQQLSILEDLDIDLFDYPLDYDVLTHGDYYDDGLTPAEEIPWLYSVVDLNFVPPAGIAYEQLEQVHIPTLSAVENEAFRITGNPIDNSNCNGNQDAKVIQPNIPECPDGYHWDYTLRQCVENDCPAGYHWDGSQCIPNPPPPPTPARQPSGTITVFDNNFNAFRPVRNARIVAKRFFKIERTYTNNQGQFFITKEFNKVHLIVKFKNDQAKIRALRRARLWQMLFPVERNLGKFKGRLNNITDNIPYTTNARSDGARHWAAATAHNTVQEYRDFAAAQGIGIPPNKLRILLTNWRLQGVSAATPMYAKRFWQTLPSDFVTTFIISDLNAIAGGLSALAMVLKSEIDITAGYNLNGNDITAASDLFNETMFHEESHAAHYNKVGNAWWQTFVNAEFSEMIAGPSPYGNGTTSNSPIIALGESWAFHMGHFMTDLKYGVNSDITTEQNIFYENGPIIEGGVVVANTGLNSHINLLEDFSPSRTVDPFRWIPQGLYNDLMDNRNDGTFGRVLLNDNVTNYTNQQFFNSLDPDISTIQDYRLRLLNENSNNQAAGVNSIFSFYGY